MSPLCWVGGKHRLADLVIKRLPEHHCYCEPFAGGAHVFFKKRPSPVEVLNDINGELANFYATLAADARGLMARGLTSLYSRAEFNRLAKTDPASLGPADRAWRFFYLNRACFGGKTCKSPDLSRTNFGTSRIENRARSFQRVIARLPVFHARLANAVIENLNWEQCLDRYDSPATCFYLDPPYAGCEDWYGAGFWQPADYVRLADRLGRLEGSFLLSINDTPAMAETFAAFRVIARPKLKYSVNRHRQTGAQELLLGKP